VVFAGVVFTDGIRSADDLVREDGVAYSSLNGARGERD